MTTDPFTTSARAEAERLVAASPTGRVFPTPLGVHMAEWARDHLAAQEPTDAEVEAAVQAIWEARSLGEPMEVLSAGHFEELEYEARAALSAARAARRDEEHVHAWRWKQNITSRGFPMPPIEVCPCGAARDARRDEEKR